VLLGSLTKELAQMQSELDGLTSSGGRLNWHEQAEIRKFIPLLYPHVRTPTDLYTRPSLQPNILPNQKQI
jgi:hypothetical protein